MGDLYKRHQNLCSQMPSAIDLPCLTSPLGQWRRDHLGQQKLVTGIASFKAAESNLLCKFMIAYVIMGHGSQASVRWGKIPT